MSNEQKLDAIVLSHKDYKEYDKVLTIFSAQNGVQKVLLRGCKKSKAKQRYAGQQFFFGEFVIAKGKGFDIVTTVEAKKTFINLATDYDAYLNACGVLKAIENSSLSQSSERQFLLLLTYLTVLESNLEKSDLLTCKFLVEYFKLQGLQLNVNVCANCCEKLKNAYFDLTNGGFVCENCRNFNSHYLTFNQMSILEFLNDNKFLKTLNMQAKTNDLKSINKLFFDLLNYFF